MKMVQLEADMFNKASQLFYVKHQHRLSDSVVGDH